MKNFFFCAVVLKSKLNGVNTISDINLSAFDSDKILVPKKVNRQKKT